MVSRGNPARSHKRDIKIAGAVRLERHRGKFEFFPDKCRSDHRPNHVIGEGVNHRFVPMGQRGTKYRLAPHRAGDDAEDRRERKQRGKCPAEALAAQGRESDEKGESQ